MTASRSAHPALRSFLGRIVGLALVVTTMAFGLASAPSAAAPTGGDSAPKPTAAMLAEEGTISGTVADAAGFEGSVSLYRWEADGEYFDWYEDDYVWEEEPSYSFTVPAGDYYLQLWPYGDGWVTSYSDGASEPPVDLSSAGVIHVEPGQSLTADLTAVPNPALRQVTGTVVDGDGNPQEDVSIELHKDLGDGDTDYKGWTETDGDGEFSFAALEGDYLLYLSPVHGDFDSMSVSFTVEDDDVALAPIVLANAGRWSVSGTITGPDGPVADAAVQLYRLWGTPGDWDDYEWEDDTSTDEDGHYSFSDVRGGASRYYTVQVSASGHTTTYYGGATNVWNADGFTLTADRTGVDVTTTRTSTISGVATLDGAPVNGVGVTLYRWYDYGDGDGEFDYYDSYYTAEDGYYSFDVAPGSYTLHFDGRFASVPLASEWLGGAGMPASPTDAGVLAVGDTTVQLTANKALHRVQSATGTVTDQAGTPISGASATAYAWDPDDESWHQSRTAITNGSGNFAVGVPSGSTVTFRFARGGYNPVFYGGGSSLPSTPTAQNSITTTDEDVAIGTIVLPPFVSKLGKVAGQKLDYCLANTLAANDDSYTDAIDLPFDLKFFGTPYDDVYVNNNGNVTFGSGQSQYTPSSLTGATSRPIIAPFFADVDTGGDGSNVVTYGSSPDGNTFCVNWADVGYYDENTDKLNTFQLLLTKNTSGAGRGPGDFDITFNYDELLWETGDASDGSNGFGGTSAAVGFSAGTGEQGTFVQLPGSFVHGALIDGGANALVAHSQGSAQAGRYVFQIRNSGHVSALGGLLGTVLRKADSAPVADAYVQACRTNGSGCSYTYTGNDGGYSFTALPATAYRLRVWPPSGSLIGGGAQVTLTAGATTEADDILLAAPTPPPAGVTITNNGHSAEGVPSVNFAEALAFALDGCAATPNPTYTVRLADGTVVRDHLALTESPAGRYTASIAPLTPNTGDATISTNVPIVCGGDPVEFNIYIDPSGIVTDQWGRPIQGVQVTLLRSDTQDGTYTVVPDGSTIMSESNRANPSFTDTTGYFRWDVQAGWYQVRAEKTGCATQTTGAMEVPPERVDLLIKLTCTSAAPTPTAAPSITGVAQVGKTIRPANATWPTPLQQSTLQLLRNGTPVTLVSGGYTLTAADVGAKFTARSTGQRPDYVQENGTGTVVTFTPVSALSGQVTGTTASTPKRTATIALKAPKKVKAGKKTKITATITVTGAKPTGKVTLQAGKKAIGTITLKAKAKGVATFTVKLKPGKHKLSATYAGSPTINPVTSAKVTVKATKPKKKKKKRT